MHTLLPSFFRLVSSCKKKLFKQQKPPDKGRLRREKVHGNSLWGRQNCLRTTDCWLLRSLATHMLWALSVNLHNKGRREKTKNKHTKNCVESTQGWRKIAVKNYTTIGRTWALRKEAWKSIRLSKEEAPKGVWSVWRGCLQRAHFNWHWKRWKACGNTQRTRLISKNELCAAADKFAIWAWANVCREINILVLRLADANPYEWWRRRRINWTKYFKVNSKLCSMTFSTFGKHLRFSIKQIIMPSNPGLPNIRSYGRAELNAGDYLSLILLKRLPFLEDFYLLYQSTSRSQRKWCKALDFRSFLYPEISLISF